MMEKYGAIIETFKVIDTATNAVVGRGLSLEEADQLAELKEGRIIQPEK